MTRSASSNEISGKAPPIVVETPDDAVWDDEAEVVVVGFGGAGVAAALEARAQGATVLALDRFRGGGATAYSGGVCYSGGGTRQQAEAGFRDSPDEMFKYLAAEGSAVSDETLRRFCEGSKADLAWLEAHGVSYSSKFYDKKATFPPDSYGLYYSGNEQLPAFRDRARPAPRGHRPLNPGFGGNHHFTKLRNSAISQGVRLMPHAPVTRLMVDRERRVIGVEVHALPQASWKKHDALYRIVVPLRPFNGERAERGIAECREFERQFGVPKRIRARAGVILSTGGFIYNLDELAAHRETVAKVYTGIIRAGSMGCDGSGINLGRSVGGATDLMGKLLLGRSIAPPEAFVYGIVVNARGERFINEDAYLALLGNAVSVQPQAGMAWLILDRPGFWRAIKESFFPGKGMFLMWGAPALFNILFGGTRRDRTLQGLARKCGIDAGTFTRTVQDFNQAVAEGRADRWGKAPDKLQAVADAPFHAINISLANRCAPTMAFTLGGLVVDETTGAVRRADGSVVNGLYAAGRAAVGLCSLGYMSGLSIADTVFSGRRAGRDAASKLSRGNGKSDRPPHPQSELPCQTAS